MGDGTQNNPFTREDVLKMIEERGGPEGLNLSKRKFEEGIDLSELDLHGIILRAQLFRARFDGSNLDSADFCHANLMYAKFNPGNSKPASLVSTDLRGASLGYAEFRYANLSCAKFGGLEKETHMKASLDEADLRGATLFLADFSGCFLYGTKLQGALIRGADLIGKANLAEADWGNDIIGEEQRDHFGDAERQYRYLRKWYASEGMYDVAGKFYFREMEVKRKAAKRARQLKDWSWLTLYGALCGHGERPLWVIAWALAVVLGLAGIYSASALTFPSSLYHSAVSFTALGYGLGVSTADGWVKALGAFEAFMGVFMMALFLITFVRKMTR